MSKNAAIAVGSAAGITLLLFLAVVIVFVMMGPAPGTASADTTPMAGMENPPACDYPHWIGQPGEAVEKDLNAMGASYRLLPPGSAMTMDYQPDRINVEMNENGVVTRVFCG